MGMTSFCVDKAAVAIFRRGFVRVLKVFANLHFPKHPDFHHRGAPYTSGLWAISGPL